MVGRSSARARAEATSSGWYVPQQEPLRSLQQVLSGEIKSFQEDSVTS